MIDKQNVWQIGSGDPSRDYSKICLDFGIAMVGPGLPGNAKEKPEAYKNESDWGIKLLQIKVGDIVLLRRGQTKIKAVGIVTRDYDYSPNLSDIHGWDLNHYIRADWYVQENGEDISLPHAMIGYSTMSNIGKNYEHIKSLINSLNLKKYVSSKSLDELKKPKEIKISELKDHFIEHGLRIGDAMNIAETINKIIILVKWYIKNNPTVLEHELRTFMVIPFLFSLGWSEQKIKIEYKKVDIALFDKPFAGNPAIDPRIIIETKKFYDGLEFARGQIVYYSKNYPNCNVMVTTNGYRYNIYKKDGSEFYRYSYFNLLDMREFDYIDNALKGVLEGIISISNY